MSLTTGTDYMDLWSYILANKKGGFVALYCWLEQGADCRRFPSKTAHREESTYPTHAERAAKRLELLALPEAKHFFEHKTKES